MPPLQTTQIRIWALRPRRKCIRLKTPHSVVFSPSCVVDPPKRWDVEPKQELIIRIMSWTFQPDPLPDFASCPNWRWKFLERGQRDGVRSISVQILLAVYYSCFFIYTLRFLFCSLYDCCSGLKRGSLKKKGRNFTKMSPSFLFCWCFCVK